LIVLDLKPGWKCVNFVQAFFTAGNVVGIPVGKQIAVSAEGSATSKTIVDGVGCSSYEGDRCECVRGHWQNGKHSKRYPNLFLDQSLILLVKLKINTVIQYNA
jgi:hypothetical protein